MYDADSAHLEALEKQHGESWDKYAKDRLAHFNQAKEQKRAELAGKMYVRNTVRDAMYKALHRYKADVDKEIQVRLTPLNPCSEHAATGMHSGCSIACVT